MDAAAKPISEPTTTGKQPGAKRWVFAVLAGLLLIVVSLPAIKTEYWIGRRERTLLFSVVDSSSNVPVPGAVITVFPGIWESALACRPQHPTRPIQGT